MREGAAATHKPVLCEERNDKRCAAVLYALWQVHHHPVTQSSGFGERAMPHWRGTKLAPPRWTSQRSPLPHPALGVMLLHLLLTHQMHQMQPTLAAAGAALKVPHALVSSGAAATSA